MGIQLQAPQLPDLKTMVAIVLILLVVGVVGYYAYSVYVLGGEGDILGIVQITIGYLVTGLIIFFVLYAIISWIINSFFKKKELRMTVESFKNIKETLLFNPYDKGAKLECVGTKGFSQRVYGTIQGIARRPASLERIYDIKSKQYLETPEEYAERVDTLRVSGMDEWTFVLFRPEHKPVWRIPILKAFAPLEILRVFPKHHSELAGNVKIYDSNIVKLGDYWYPATYLEFPSIILEAVKNDSMIYANLSLLDYVSLVAGRGIEGDTSLQKWLLSKSDTIRTAPLTGETQA